MRGFAFGLAAGAASLALAYLLRVSLGAVFLPELAVNTLVTKTPGSVESTLVINLQSLAKYSAFAGAITTNVILYGVVAFILTRLKRKPSFLDRIPLYS